MVEMGPLYVYVKDMTENPIGGVTLTYTFSTIGGGVWVMNFGPTDTLGQMEIYVYNPNLVAPLSWVCSATGYDSATGNGWLWNGDVIHLEAETPTGILAISATLDGASTTGTCIVDSISGTIPSTIILDTGTYTIIATVAGQTQSKNATITAGATTILTFAFTSDGGGGGNGGGGNGGTTQLPLILLMTGVVAVSAIVIYWASK